MNISTTDIIDKVVMVAALSFSGIYRVSLILFSSLIFDKQTIDLTGETYLLFTLATSLFGLPLSSVFMRKNNEESYSMFFLVFLFQ